MMRNILIIASGSVAIKKTIYVIRQLQENGFNVKTISTHSAKTNFEDINIINTIKQKSGFQHFPLHIELTKWSDLILVVPATANIMSKYALGISDTFSTTILLASRTPIIFVPAMNTYMYRAIQKRKIIDKIIQLGSMTIGPCIGKLQEGEVGIGRMTEPEEIVKKVKNYFNNKKKIVFLPYGATKINIDPMRYFTSNSTGVMGKVLANELRLNGFKVIDVDIKEFTNKDFINFAKSIDFDVYISPAAFADIDINYSEQKIKKSNINLIKFKTNIDVISKIKKIKTNSLFYAFKLDDNINNAIVKLNNLSLDGIIWNKLGSFGTKNITGAFINCNNIIHFTESSKLEVAKIIVEQIKKAVK